MRPVDKGAAPNTYTVYGDARHDLANKIGYYCSYCEMGVNNMIEVEHVHPTSKGGNSISWDNFLLSCKYCNTIKSNHNPSRKGYVWPDIDNTDLVFDYPEKDVIKPKTTLPVHVLASALKTIELMGLDREPGQPIEPTQADIRWVSRYQAWDKAKKSHNNWIKLSEQILAEQIGITSLDGHYSIWTEVFKNDPLVLTEIDNAYVNYGLYKEYLVGTTTRKTRTAGQI